MKNVLVFPCGSEIALEVYRAAIHSAHFHLVGASSVNDHGRFVYEDYVDGVPFITEPGFIDSIKKIIADRKIDAVYPAMDAVIEILKSHEKELGVPVISSPVETTRICLSKSATYKHLEKLVRTPRLYTEKELEDAESLPYPLFAKPDIGYGSRGAKKLNSAVELKAHLESFPTCIVTEYLPGEEFTIDCFSDKDGNLIFSAPRKRIRIMNGISVHTAPVKNDLASFDQMAQQINAAMNFRGAWFFQAKYDSLGKLALMEVASRFGGSSSLFRAQGVNFALMSIFDAFDIPVSLLRNHYNVEMDRALDNKYKVSIDYNEVFVDFDDCIYLEKKNVNEALMAFLFRCINKGIKVSLLSRHDDVKLGRLEDLLQKLRIAQVFDRVIHIDPSQKKIDFIDNTNAIFIDDSFAERKAVAEKFNMPVFSLDMVEVL